MSRDQHELPDIPYFERGLLDAILRKDEQWAWNMNDLVRREPGCGITAVSSAVRNLKKWGYLRIWRESRGFRQGVISRHHVYLNGDAPRDQP